MDTGNTVVKSWEEGVNGDENNKDNKNKYLQNKQISYLTLNK